MPDTMSDQDDSLAARGSPRGFGVHVCRSEDRETSRSWMNLTVGLPVRRRFKNCKVKSHEDVPKHDFEIHKDFSFQYTHTVGS